MRKTIKNIFLTLCLLVATLLPLHASAADKDIVILYTNDIHCAIDDNESLAGLSQYKQDVLKTTPYVALVDAGDAIQGSPIGKLSSGEVFTNLMNAIGYDFAIPGNHEYLKGVVKTLPEHWKTLFPNPHNGPLRFLGTTYYVDFPGLRIIAIDTDGMHRVSDYTQVAFWLMNVLRQSEGRFTIVMMHHPVYSTAKGRCNPLMWLAFHSAMREADVVFSGHDHNYARRIEQYKARFWKKEEPTIFITTNASNKVYPNKKKDLSTVANELSVVNCFSGEPVYEHILVLPNSLCISTYKLNSGELIDEVQINR